MGGHWCRGHTTSGPSRCDDLPEQIPHRSRGEEIHSWAQLGPVSFSDCCRLNTHTHIHTDPPNLATIPPTFQIGGPCFRPYQYVSQYAGQTFVVSTLLCSSFLSWQAWKGSVFPAHTSSGNYSLLICPCGWCRLVLCQRAECLWSDVASKCLLSCNYLTVTSAKRVWCACAAPGHTHTHHTML